MIRRDSHSRLPDLGILLLLLVLPLLLFGSVVWGSKTLLPADILFSFEPYQTAADDLGVPYPHNHLLADLILENYAWKRFLTEALHNRQLPLWDPYIFAGHPFLANGQHSALYPLNVVFYALPLWRAYGVFAWLQLGLAGAFAYLFARVLGIRRMGGLIAGITFQFSGFMVVSVVHPMIIAGASWLPLVLAMVELVVQQRPALAGRPTSLPWALLGAAGLGCQILAGHAENTYFVLLVTALYAAWRLAEVALSNPPSFAPDRSPSIMGPDTSSSAGGASRTWGEAATSIIRPTLWLTLMVALGLALGAVQLVPLYEVVSTSFRGGEEAASLQQVLSWAYPPRRLIAFAIPNFFGNPAHHAFFDLFSWRRVPAPQRGDGQYIYWGVKNYVEGGAYLGLLPLLLSILAVASWLAPRMARLGARVSRRFIPPPRGDGRGLHAVPFFTLLSLFSLGCIFGTPLYAVVYALPFLKQSHSPFRWVFPLTVSVAVLAGYGVETIQRSRANPWSVGQEEPGSERAKERETRCSGRSGPSGRKRSTGASALVQRLRTWRERLRGAFLLDTSPTLVSVLASLAFWGGLATLASLVLSRVFFAQLEPLIERVFLSLAGAPSAFTSHQAFYSYEAVWIALFGFLLTGSGIVLRLSRCPIFVRKRPVWEIAAVGLLILDLICFGRGFHPAVDPALLDYVPPAVGFLKDRAGPNGAEQATARLPWRYAAFTPPGTGAMMKANTGMLHDLQTVAGYDSIFSDQYRDYMALIEKQDQVAYNLIAPLRNWSSLDSPLTDLLNVKYVITEVEIPNPKYEQVYQDEAVRVYENLGAMPRAFTLPTSATLATADFGSAVQDYDPRRYVVVEENDAPTFQGSDAQTQHATPGTHVAQTISSYTINEVFVDVDVTEPSWLILTDSYFGGWKAFVRPQAPPGSSLGHEAGEEELQIHRVNGNFRGVRLEDPGAWTVRFKYTPNSVKVGAFISFIAGMTLLFLAGLYLWRFFYVASDDGDTVQRVAKNSIAPIVLNFFNRIIDFAFAALMARILGPGGMGRYFTAANIYLWFDTLANFGLDMYLIREVARDRQRTRQVLLNTTLLRLLLFVAVIPILVAFLAGRQALQNPLTSETLWAVALLYGGLLPGTMANSLTALFRAFEKHEYPAAIQTVTTIIRVTLGTLVLVGGLGIVGLAGASIVTNIATMTILALLAWRLIWPQLPPAPTQPPVQRWWSRQRAMLVTSWPLMGSLLLQSLFTGANVVLLQYFRGDDAVGWYNAASKWVMNMLNIIPSLFTFAVFPVLSRQAAEDRGRLRRSYQLSVKLLTIVALPTAVTMTLLATPLVWLLSGPGYLPQGAVALRLLVWSIIFGWINSLTNYVLIALNRQRYVVWASAARVVFAVAANLTLVPRFGYVASAWIIIGGELVLNLLFAADLRRHLGLAAWGEIVGRPAAAGAVMAATAWLIGADNWSLALLSSLVIYAVSLILLRALTAEERQRLASLLPAPLRRAIGRLAP
jgi:O-antigen/teichoic acid export membrane protein